ncbi:MAG TPA: phosphotransferase [Micromonosporaceae bacterium]|nr:phosphotransferase [Micromonosporaceae bacterium]
MRLDAARVVRRLAEQTGTMLVVEGPCPGGQVGAAYVRWPDGRRSVLTFGTATAPPLLDIARAAGVPAPRYELVTDVDGTIVVVQERLPGAPSAMVDRRLVEQMIALNHRFAGLLAERRDLPLVELYLSESGPGYCLHEALTGYDRRTRQLLDWVHEVGRDHRMPDVADLVHGDYHPGNILASGGRIAGVVDWDGAGRGDRHLDLVTLRFDLALRAPQLTGWMDELLGNAVPRPLLRAYWAHMSLRLVDWAIRHHSAAEVDLWLATAAIGIRTLS